MIDEAIEILKNYCEIFRYTQKSMDKSLREIYGDTVGAEEVSAIETLLTAYEKEKEKIQKAIDFINDENNFFEDGENWQNILKIKNILEE